MQALRLFGVAATAFGLVLVPLGQARADSAATTFNVSNNGITSYMIDGSSNPTLNLMRGETYTFQIAATGHPFWIKTIQSIGTVNAYNDGVTGNGTENGTLTFVVPPTAPSTLYYDCQFHAVMTGQINVTGPTPTLPLSWGLLKARYR